ncbi:death effector domain-containing protein-like [Argopecten irradians]|uniref:death effector domain-containing protein-like n=1 Tax=Argopecten irradians TaxID=31199 RepID=UPI0037238D1C
MFVYLKRLKRKTAEVKRARCRRRDISYKMATNSDSPANDVDENYMSMSLHEMFHIVGDQMTENDIKFLKFFCAGLISEEMTSMVNDGFSFLLCMEKMNLVSESNFMNVLDLLRIINRHDLSQYVHLRCRKTVRRDPICDYLESHFSHQQSRVTPYNTEVIDDREKKSDQSQCGVVGGSDQCCEDTTVSQHNNNPRSYRQISDTPGSVHSQLSGSNCQTSPVTSSTLTSVSSSSSPSSSSKTSPQKSLSIDVPAMSTRSKRQRSGDSADGSGASCDNTPSPCHKRRRKDTERNTVKAHDSTSTDVSHRGSGSSNDVSADSTVQERLPSDMNSSNTQEEGRSPSEEGRSPPEEGRSPPEEGRTPSGEGRSPLEEGRTPTEEGRTSDTVQPDCTDNSSHAVDQTNFSKSSNSSESGTDSKKETITCDIRLRVRAEVSLQESTLEGNVFSNKPTVVERQCEKFMQASTVLKSHDLGSIVCDIKFSDLTYLDAFWRDYINGSLLEALKGVFLTESLKQTVGHEAIKLLVNVDEDDYEAGRIKLLQNMKS